MTAGTMTAGTMTAGTMTAGTSGHAVEGKKYDEVSFTVTVMLVEKDAKIILAQAGSYRLEPEGPQREEPIAAGPPAAGWLLLAAAGDFIVARPVRSGQNRDPMNENRRIQIGPEARQLDQRPGAGTDPSQRACQVVLNNRPVLGGVQRLVPGDVIRLRSEALVRGENAGGSWRYQPQNPPLQFALPETCDLSCRYSRQPLGGQTALRCPGCFRLFALHAAWQADLDGVCPDCGWSAVEASS